MTDPAVGKYHKKSTHDGKITEKEIEVEYEAIAEGLGDNNAHETEDGVVGVFARDYH